MHDTVGIQHANGDATHSQVEFVVARYDYTAQDETELTLRKGQRLRLMDDSKNWWKVANDNNESGMVPSNYVRKEKLIDTLKRKMSQPLMAGHAVGMPVDQTLPGRNEPTVQARGRPGNTDAGVHTEACDSSAIIKYNYAAKMADEMSLLKGAKITIQRKSSDGWWYGADSNGSSGWFPSNYVIEQSIRTEGGFWSSTPQPAQGPSAVKMRNGSSSTQQSHNSSGVLFRVRGLYNFDSADPMEELSFVKGERLDVVDCPSDDPQWYLCRNGAGNEGLVPRNYVKRLQDDELQDDMRTSDPVQSVPNVASLALRPPLPTGSKAPPPLRQQQQQQLSPREQQQHTNGHSSANSSRESNGLKTPADIRNGLSASNVLAHKDWYFGVLTRDAADILLGNFGAVGDFIVRESESNLGDCSISLCAPTGTRNKHFLVKRIDNETGHRFHIGTKDFGSLDELVEHYTRSPIYTDDSGLRLFLQRPLPSR